MMQRSNLILRFTLECDGFTRKTRSKTRKNWWAATVDVVVTDVCLHVMSVQAKLPADFGEKFDEVSARTSVRVRLTCVCIRSCCRITTMRIMRVLLRAISR
jgi:hypothetical protein